MRTAFMDIGGFYQGQEFEAYRYLGGQITEFGAVFRTYAPAADHVSVIGEFTGWQEYGMNRICDGKFWECYVDGAMAGQMYKYRIYHRNGSFTDHADPYAFYSQLRPDTASILYDMQGYAFDDEEWMRTRTDCRNRPLNIYELHLGSWRRRDEDLTTEPTDDFELPEDASGGWYRYDEIADMLIPYLAENGYNYVEFMPLNEYPADESWGYQATGFFSATARYGEPDQLKYLVDRLHQSGIGVILDVVTVHFATNDYGLLTYDGTPLFEYPHPSVGRSEWGSSNIIHARGEVRSFLQSACDFWLSVYHFDGLRFDAVGNLIYWMGNERRGVNLDAVRFLRNMNSGLKGRHGGIMLIAEDSTAYPGVTSPAWDNGLAFDYKWDMGWMNDTLDYFEEWPVRRSEKYHKLTFSMQYFYNEKYLLPLSHDEVVHGKATILQKMYGFYEGKFPQARALYLYMFLHPGKKLNFMGNEIGQIREWDERRQQDWFLSKYPLHDSFHHFMIRLNHLYLEHSALWERDYERDGFEWIQANGERDCVYVFRRRSSKESLLCLFNLCGEARTYDFHPGWKGRWTLLLDTDEDTWSGNRHYDTREELRIDADESHPIALAPFSGRCYLETGC